MAGLSNHLERERLRLGAILLTLVSDWDGWVSRRVDSFYFSGDDERVLHRHQSVDFVVPPILSEIGDVLLKRYGGLPIPLTFLSKWRLPEFSLRGGDGQTRSLLERSESVPISTAMLIALATFVKGGERPEALNGRLRMPPRVREELEEIAEGEPTASIRRCVDFQYTEIAADTDRLWRRELAESELFMSLAYELAAGFAMIAILPTNKGGRQVLKFSYDSSIVPARRDRVAVRIAHGFRWMAHFRRDAIDPVEWKRSSSLRRISAPQPAPSQTGSLVVSTSCDGAPEQLQHGAPSVASAIGVIDGPGRGRLNVRIRPTGLIAIGGLPQGSYQLSIRNCSGFAVEPRNSRFEIDAGQTTRVTLRARRRSFAKGQTRAAPAIARLPWWPKRISRGLGWNSKPLAIRVRLGGGGSYHCEFKAPAGLHVTRAKLVSNLDGNEGDEAARRKHGARYVDTVLKSDESAHLYGQALGAGPATGYVFLNLRPRAETIVRPAFFTAIFTLGILGILALIWNFGEPPSKEGNSRWTLFAILLAGPGALAAYFAQAVPSRVTNAMLYGVRLAALLPVAISLLAAAAAFAFNEDAGTPLIVICGAAVIPVVLLGITYGLAEHPIEQQPVSRHQGPDFEETHLPPAGPEVHIPPTSIGADVTGRDLRAAVRDRMLERLGGMTEATRRKLLGQRSFRFWEREVPPELYFRSAEQPAVFLGVHSGAAHGRLRRTVRKHLAESAGLRCPD